MEPKTKNKDVVTPETEKFFAVTDAAHDYEVKNTDGSTQTIKFIKKEVAVAGQPELVTVSEGTTTEAVLEVAKDRLETLYAILPDQFTLTAINHIGAALGELANRTADRKARGVEGRNDA
jgi:hypothetical protein